MSNPGSSLDPSQVGTQAPWQQGVGLFGSALKDIAAQLAGRPEDANSITQFQQLQRQNALRQAVSMAATTNDPKQASQANAIMLANGMDPSMIQKYRANQEMPSILAGMQPKEVLNDNPVGVTPAVNATGSDADAQRAAALAKNSDPMSTLLPGQSVMDLLNKPENADAAAQMAPAFLDAQIKANMPFTGTLQPGEHAFVGGHDVASAPALRKFGPNGVAYDPANLQPGTVFNNPNQAFNADGTPNANFQNFEIRKAAAGPIARTESNLGMGIPLDAAAINSHVANVLGGNETMAQVPQPYRQAVSNAMVGKTFTPTAQQRYTTAAAKITAPYTAMSSYKLASDGLPYLQRIAAAAQTPGSVSDQDLLDSLTKLNTGGNAVTDAQVKLITEGKSFGDWANVLGNRLKNGGELSDNQRQQIQNIAGNIYSNYRKGYGPVYQEVANKLQTAGIPQQFWTIPNLDSIASKQGDATGNLQGSGARGSQVQTRLLNGKTYHNVGGKWFQE